MKIVSIKSFVALLFCCLVTLGYSQDACEAVGWATQNGGTSGGGNASPVVVTNYNDLKSAVTDDNVSVVHISGTINISSRITIQDLSDKTIIGLPGAKLVSTNMSKDGSGIFYIKRVENLIMRNIIFEGPGAYDTDGWDNLALDDCRNIWVDHCEFHDGVDGNFDIKNKSDYISVTWCTFSYEKPPKAGGPGGSDDHRYTNLIGSSDGATADEGKLKITFQYNWWGEGCKERMPRVRYGQVHLVNNYYSSSVANQGARAGYKANLRIEGNYFIAGYKKPVDEFNKDYTAILAKDNQGASNLTKGSAFTPPYSLTIANANDIVTPITTCGGATLTDFNSCSCGGTPSANPVVSINSPSNGQQFTSVPSTTTFSASATDQDGSVSTIEAFVNNQSIGSTNGSSYTDSYTFTQNGTYTIKFVATDNEGNKGSKEITVQVGEILVAATLTKKGSGSSTQTLQAGEAIVGFSYLWSGASSVETSGFPSGLVFDIDPSSSLLAISGTPTQTGTFSFSVTTIGGSPNATKTGTITITGSLPNQAPSVNFTSPTQDNMVYNLDEQIVLSVNANDADGTITSIDYYINNQKVGSGASFTLPATLTGNYTLYAIVTDNESATTQSQTLNFKVVQPDCNGDENGNAYLDNCKVCVEGNTGRVACTSLFEAEYPCAIEGIEFENENSGFSGEGYANSNNQIGASAQWYFKSDEAKNANINVRFANGGTSPRSALVFVNDAQIATLELPITGGWSNWELASIEIPLLTGRNKIVFEANSDEGLANLDAFFFYNQGVTAQNCDPVLSLNTSPVAATVYPNPVETVLYLTNTVSWKLSNAQRIQLNSGTSASIDMSNYTTGIYILSIDGKVVQVSKL